MLVYIPVYHIAGILLCLSIYGLLTIDEVDKWHARQTKPIQCISKCMFVFCMLSNSVMLLGILGNMIFGDT